MTELKKVIIIDDERCIRTLLEQTLEDLEDDDLIELLPSAADGQEGLDSITQNSPDIIIMDIMMPKLNGFEVYNRIKKDNLVPNADIIMVSAKSQTTDVNKAEELDITHYVTKPFDPDDILEKVKNLL